MMKNDDEVMRWAKERIRRTIATFDPATVTPEQLAARELLRRVPLFDPPLTPERLEWLAREEPASLNSPDGVESVGSRRHARRRRNRAADTAADE